jgi:hypothetical protein
MQELMGAEAAEGSTSGSPPTGSTGSAMQRLGLGTLQEHAVRGVTPAAADGSRGASEAVAAAAEDSFQFQRSAMEGRSSRYSGEMIMGFDTLNSHRLEEDDDDDETSDGSDDSDDGEDVEADRWQANLESRLFGHFVMPESEHA